MAVVLPSFEDTLCRMMGVCSFLTGPTASLPSEDIHIVASYVARPGKALARLIWNAQSKHFHIDVALRAAFGEHSPKADTSISSFRKKLALFDGLTAAAYPHGYFSIPVSSLPSAGGLIFTGNSSIKLKVGKTEIKLTGATLSFHDSEIRKMRWDLVDDRALLDMEAKRREVTIGEGFLTDALKVFDAAVATYILGKKSDARTSL